MLVCLGAQLKDYHQGLVHYHLPESGLTWARIFGLMESAKTKYQIEDYSVGQTTLEQVIRAMPHSFALPLSQFLKKNVYQLNANTTLMLDWTGT